MTEQGTLDFNGPEMTADETIVWNVLCGCKGQALAATQKDMASVCGMSTRHIRLAVQSLIVDHGKPIGSSYDSNHGGYYLIETEQEAQETQNKMISHARKILKRAAAIGQTTVTELAGKL